MAVTATFVVNDDQLTPQPVENVKVYLYDSSDVYLTEGLTDAVGEVDFALDGDPDPGREYIVRLRKDSWSFPDGSTQRVYVHEPLVPPATNVFDFTAHELTVPESLDPNFCKLSGYLIDVLGRAVAKKTLVFHQRYNFPEHMAGGMYPPGEPSIVSRAILVADGQAESDEDGYVELELPRGGLYDVHIYGLEDPANIIFPIVVPDAAGWKLEDVLFPYVTQVTFGSDPINVAAGELAEVQLTVGLSDGRSLTDCVGVGDILDFASADEGVATVLVAEGVLQVTGVAVGTTTVTAARTDRSYAPRLPDISALVVTPATVEVS